MKVLWVTNNIFPEPAEYLGIEKPVVGGWMYGLAENIKKSNITLTIVSPGFDDLDIENLNGTNYVTLKIKNNIDYYDRSLEDKWKVILKKYDPDIVHIHGTEYTHGLALMKVFPKERIVISIQGLISVYERYFLGSLSNLNILKNISIRDIVKIDTLFNAKNNFKKRGYFEKEYLKNGVHFVGRTDWDKAHIYSNNIKSKYYHGDEILRSSFYTSPKWNISKKEKYTIFLSQAAYPIKGLHQVLQAIFLLKNKYPNMQLRVGGTDILKNNLKFAQFRISGYAKLIKRLIRKYDLEGMVTFLGNLNEHDMIDEYLRCGMFICPSSIENSPNSLGEAQFLGVPCIASYVGGIPNMVEHNETGLLYRFEEVEMLAQNIITLIEDDSIALKLSNKGIKVAEKRHNILNNVQKTIEIYKSVLDI